MRRDRGSAPTRPRRTTRTLRRCFAARFRPLGRSRPRPRRRGTHRAALAADWRRRLRQPDWQPVPAPRRRRAAAAAPRCARTAARRRSCRPGRAPAGARPSVCPFLCIGGPCRVDDPPTQLSQEREEPKNSLTQDVAPFTVTTTRCFFFLRHGTGAHKKFDTERPRGEERAGFLEAHAGRIQVGSGRPSVRTRYR